MSDRFNSFPTASANANGWSVDSFSAASAQSSAMSATDSCQSIPADGSATRPEAILSGLPKRNVEQVLAATSNPSGFMPGQLAQLHRRYAHEDHTLNHLGQKMLKSQPTERAPYRNSRQIAAELLAYQRLVRNGNPSSIDHRALRSYVNVNGKLTKLGLDLINRLKGDQFNTTTKSHLEEWKTSALPRDEFIALHKLKKNGFKQFALSNHTLTAKGERFLAAAEVPMYDEPDLIDLSRADVDVDVDVDVDELEARLQFFEEIGARHRDSDRLGHGGLDMEEATPACAGECADLPELDVDEIDSLLTKEGV